MQIKQTPLSDLHTNEANPRTITDGKFGKLIGSLLVLPKMLELRPIVTDSAGTALGGNMRLRALQAIADLSPEDVELRLHALPDFAKKSTAQQLALIDYWRGWLEDAKHPVPSVVADELSDGEKREFIIKDNASFGEWDWDALSNEWDTAELNEWGLDVWQPTDEGVAADAQEDDFDEETDAITVKCKPGDIWQLGDHRLMCGDSTDETNFIKLLEGNEARLCVTSPPYGVGKSYEEAGIGPWKETIFGVIEAITRHARIIVWNIGDLFATGTQFIEPTSMYSTQKMKDCGFSLMYARIWKKQGGNFAGTNPYYTVSMKPVQEYEWILGYAKTDYEKDYAPIISWMAEQAKIAKLDNTILKDITGAGFMYGHWFTSHQWAMLDKQNYEKIAKYCQDNGIDAFVRDYDELRREYENLNIYGKILTKEDESAWGQWGIWEIATVNRRTGDHPAEFPVELPARCIKMHARPGDIILDPFGGSGTTMVAAEQLGRKCYMMELDPHYCDIIIARWEKLTGRTATRVTS